MIANTFQPGTSLDQNIAYGVEHHMMAYLSLRKVLEHSPWSIQKLCERGVIGKSKSLNQSRDKCYYLTYRLHSHRDRF